jgi:tRNA wybutosine-synthesizing protein 3
LSKLDKSPKGSIDAPITELIHAINAHDDYVTTSSCSGRIALFETVDDQRGRWLLVEHATVTSAQVEAALAAPAADAASRLVAFKHEPAIVHVQCRDVPAAERLLQAGLRAGFRESGIVLSSSCKVMLALRTTANCLELPLVVNGEALLPAHALGVLVEHANSKFAANLARLQALAEAFDELSGSRRRPAAPAFVSGPDAG